MVLAGRLANGAKGSQQLAQDAIRFAKIVIDELEQHQTQGKNQ